MLIIQVNTRDVAGTSPLSFRLRCKAGFTLVELLVVIAVVAILAALIFPSIMKSTAAAKAAQCVSNMRQIGGMISNYILEGRIVQYEYMPGQYERNWKSILISQGFASPLEINKVTYCPLWNPALSTYEGSPNNWFCYGWDVGAMQVNYDNLTGMTSVTSPANTVSIERASSYILLADSIARNPSAWTSNSDKTKNYQVAQISISGPNGSWNPEGCLHLRHSGRANVLFLDGHVQAMIPAEIRSMLNTRNQVTTPFYYWDETLKDRVQP